MTTAIPTASAAARPRRSTVTRVLAIARAEFILYARKPLILVPAILMGPTMAVLLGPAVGRALEGPAFSMFLVEMLTTWALLMVVYYNTTMIAVTRRNEGVYQRMATGQASAWEAFIAACIPSGVIVVIQIVLGTAAAAFLFPFSMPNPILPVVGIVGGIIFLAAAAAWTSSWTSDVAAAQFTTLPLFLGLYVSSGTMLPPGIMPCAVDVAFSLSPLRAVNDLIGVGMVGTNLAGTRAGTDFVGTWSAASAPLGVLAAWTALAVLLARRTMRFERRH